MLHWPAGADTLAGAVAGLRQRWPLRRSADPRPGSPIPDPWSLIP